MSDIEKSLTELSDEIKNKEFSKLYFFCGKENYLKKFYIDKIVYSVLDENSIDMNYDIITKSEYSLDRVKESINTLPFLAEKRVVLLQDIDVLNKDELSEIFLNISNDVIVILNEDSAKKSKTEKKAKDDENTGSKKKKNADVLKTIKSVGKIIEINEISDSIAVKKVMSVVKQNHKVISREDAEYMINRIGIDLSLIMNEVEKLISYAGVRETITKHDIDEICTQSLESKIFDLIKDICSKKIDSSIKQYHALLTNKEPQVLILFMIARQYMIMYEALSLDAKGYSVRQIAEKTEAKQEFVARECLMQGKRYGLKKLSSIIKECLSVDVRLKNGEDCLELLLYKLLLEF